MSTLGFQAYLRSCFREYCKEGETSPFPTEQELYPTLKNTPGWHFAQVMKSIRTGAHSFNSHALNMPALLYTEDPEHRYGNFQMDTDQISLVNKVIRDIAPESYISGWKPHNNGQNDLQYRLFLFPSDTLHNFTDNPQSNPEALQALKELRVSRIYAERFERVLDFPPI